MGGFGRGKSWGHWHRDTFVIWWLLGVTLSLMFRIACKCKRYLQPWQTGSALSLASFRCHSFRCILEQNNHHRKQIYPLWFVFLYAQRFQKEALLGSKLASGPGMLLPGAHRITLSRSGVTLAGVTLSCSRPPDELWETGRGSSGTKSRKAESVDARPSSNGNSHSPFRPMKS